MKKIAVLGSLCIVLLGSTAAVVPASAAPHTPKVGSRERTGIMNALHKVLGSGKHQPLVVPSHLKVEKGWAFVSGGFTYADHAPLESEFTQGSGTNFSALLHLENGKWKVKRRLYHGDVVAPEFMRNYPQAPRTIFLET